MRKKGELAISTVILLILGLFILVAAIFLVSTQKAKFSDVINVFYGGANVDSVVESCNGFVESEQVYSYCCEKKKVRTDDETFEMTCFELKDEGFVGGRIYGIECDLEC